MKGRVQYFAGHSILHRMHPLVKSAWLVVMSISIFLVPSHWFILAVLVLLWVSCRLTGVDLNRLPGMRMIFFTTLMLTGLQLVFVRSGEIGLQLGRCSVTLDGVRAGVYVGGRFLSIVLLSYLFVLTTQPDELAYALMQVGVPYRYGYTLITALRMVPMFQIEADTIYKAQLARGMRYDHGGLRRIIDMARRFFMPLLVSALSRADTLAVSMEGRCFGMHKRRTYLRRVAMRTGDFLSLGILAVWTVTIAWLRLRLG